jgi:hypothetical protein
MKNTARKAPPACVRIVRGIIFDPELDARLVETAKREHRPVAQLILHIVLTHFEREAGEAV